MGLNSSQARILLVCSSICLSCALSQATRGAAPWPETARQQTMVRFGSSLRLRGGLDANTEHEIPLNTPLRKILTDRRSTVKTAMALRSEGGPGVLDSTDVAKLMDAGVIQGPWVGPESEEEPWSDVQDAYEQAWPVEWGGEEETDPVLKAVPGPVRLYSTNKYNKDVLPSGHVSEETKRRLEPQLRREDPGAYSQVSINAGNGPFSGPQRKEEDETGPNTLGTVQASVLPDVPRTEKNMHRGVDLDSLPLPAGVSISEAKKWLDEVHMSVSKDKDKKKVNNKNDESEEEPVEPHVDLDSHAGNPERRQAEKSLDQAILEEDETAIHEAIQNLKDIDANF